MADGAVYSLNKRCDAGIMFFYATKNNNDPIIGP
jgi:hypothetical protein